MGFCSCCSPGEEKIGKEGKFKKEEGKDISQGPVKKRGCTDIVCLLIFLFAWVFYVFVSFLGVQDGNISKLYSPRDYQGAYCGVTENWNNGPNLENGKKLSYTMNVTMTVDQIAKQMLCSTAAKDALFDLWATSSEYETYLCECCLSQCAKCTGSLALGGDLALSNLETTITDRISKLTTNNVADLYDPAGSNGNYFSEVWEAATAYLLQVCLDSCGTDYSSELPRNYLYTLSGDDPLKPAWDALAASGPDTIKVAMASFSFPALPLSKCPYAERYCVPFPGVTFKDMDVGDWCELEMGADVVSAVGSALASSYQSLGTSSIASDSSENLGTLVGDLQESWLAHVVVAVCAFIIGFLFMVALRFTVGVCVWMSIFGVLAIFALAGGMSYVYSFQCADASIFDTGKQTAVAVTSAGAATVVSAATGKTYSEALTGDGADYRGVQTVTRDGKTCQEWSSMFPHVHSFTSANYPSAELEKNYCRNPYNDGDVNKASTIWCLTTDSEQIWGECSPIGQITQECESGYAITSETMRKVAEILGYVIWALGGLFLLLIICKCGAIRDAIAVNKTAAMFMYNTPRIWFVPIVQITLAFCWLLIWVPLAGLLLSQVPDDYTPNGWYASYAEAAGTADAAGQCTDEWPTGFAWKDEECTTEDGVVKCWRCAQPRYAFDWRSWYVIFFFLWNNALLIACGQCIIAGAVCAWFFAKNGEKGKVRSISQAVWNVLRYHLGSLAFGSFILAVVQFIRLILLYFEKQAEAQKNYVMQLVLKVVQCCMWCFEKSIKFLNKQAYIQIALMGTNFCTSAFNAFWLILRNAVRFAFIIMLGGVINTIGWVFITIGTTIVGYLVVRSLFPDISFVGPVFLYAAIGYLVGRLNMNIFGLAVDTSLQCLIAAEEMDMEGVDDFVPKPMKSRLKIPKKDEKEPQEEPT